MIGSLIVGSALVVLGGFCVMSGVSVAVVGAIRPPAAQGFATIKQVVKLLEAVRDILKEFGKLDASGRLLVVGVALLAGGIWLLAARPF